MACDLQGTIGGHTKIKVHTKIFQMESPVHPEPFIMGVAGSVNDMMDIVDYFANPESGRPPRIKDSTVLVLTQSGKIYYASNPIKWLRVRQPYMAIGSGQQFALGAMSAGASPKEAVRSAFKQDPFTGMGTKVLKF